MTTGSLSILQISVLLVFFLFYTLGSMETRKKVCFSYSYLLLTHAGKKKKNWTVFVFNVWLM